jgi:hypothetical protein
MEDYATSWDLLENSTTEHIWILPNESDYETVNLKPKISLSKFKRNGLEYSTRITFKGGFRAKDFKMLLQTKFHVRIQTNLGTLFEDIPNENAAKCLGEIILKMYDGTVEYAEAKLGVSLKESAPEVTFEQCASIARAALISNVQ